MRRTASLLLAAPAAAILLGSGSLFYREGPPPGFTGGFGEESCGGCHYGGDVNDAAGTLRLDGVPSQYEPGRRYPIIVSLSRAGMEAGGFQLTARVQGDGSQAGVLEPESADVQRVAVTRDRDILYLHQLDAGSDATATDSLRWRIVWTAPTSGDEVVFHASANAANGDGSVSGDFVYTAESTTRPR
jgi:hypothetical protein